MQVFRVLRSPEPRLGLLGNQRSLVTVAPLPTPPVELLGKSDARPRAALPPCRPCRICLSPPAIGTMTAGDLPILFISLAQKFRIMPGTY